MSVSKNNGRIENKNSYLDPPLRFEHGGITIMRAKCHIYFSVHLQKPSGTCEPVFSKLVLYINKINAAS